MNIYNILSADNVTVEDLEKHKEIIIREINTAHTEHSTPITYYCMRHLRSGINTDVLEMLITEFKADVNLSPNDNTPLTIVLTSSTAVNAQNIALLLQYTSKLPTLTTHDNQSLLVRMLCSPNLSNQSYILQDFGILVKRNIQEQLLNHVHTAELYALLTDALLNLQSSPEHMELVFNIRAYIEQVLYDYNFKANTQQACMEQLFNDTRKLIILAFNKQNWPLVKILVEKQIFGVPSSDNNWMHELWQEHINTKYQLQLETLLSELFIDNNIGHNIMVHGVMFHIPNINNNSQKEKQRISDIVIKAYNEHDDHQMIISYLGFQNNIFHVLALDTTCSQDTLLSFFAFDRFRDQHYDLLLSYNVFGQTPLKIALLAHNSNFLLFLTRLVSLNPSWKNKLLNTPIDHDNNTVLHIVAQIHLSADDLEKVLSHLKAIGFSDTQMMTTSNTFGQTAIFYAVMNNNDVFTDWWARKKGVFDIVDHNGQTLWHHFAKIPVYVNDPNREHKQAAKKIHQVLQFHIPESIHSDDMDNLRPIDISISSSSLVLKLILDNHYKNLNFQHQNKLGNTISHIINQAFIDDRPAHYNLAHQKEIIDLLIPYHKDMQANYKIKNINNQTPTDILKSGMNRPLPALVHQKISNAILKVVAVLHDRYTEEKTISTEVTDSFDIPLSFDRTGRILNIQKNHEILYDNKLFIFSDEVLHDAVKVHTNQLSPFILDQIHVLSFDIVFSDTNRFGDKVPHYLLTVKFLGLSTELTFMHLLNMIPHKLRDVLLETHNNLGQYLIHIGIQAQAWHAVDYLLSLNPAFINTPTALINDEYIKALLLESFAQEGIIEQQMIGRILQSLYPADYATIFIRDSQQDIARVLLAHQQEKKGSIFARIPMKDEANLLVPYITYINAMPASAATRDQAYDPIYVYEQLMQVRERWIGNTNTFTPYLLPHIKYMTQAVKYLKYDIHIEYIKSLENLATVLTVYHSKLQGWFSSDHDRVKFLVLGYDHHASALAVFRDRKQQYHALIQDSFPENTINQSDYDQRQRGIKRTLMQTLSMKAEHIHEFKVPQQGVYDFNCALWTVANLKVMMASLFVKNSNCLICSDIILFLSLREYINEPLLEEIKHNLATQSPEIVKQLQEYTNECHQKSCSLQKQDVETRNFYKPTNSIDDLYQRIKWIRTYHNVELSDQNIRDIVKELDTQIFVIDGMQDHIDDIKDSNKAKLIVIPKSDNTITYSALSRYIKEYMEDKQNTHNTYSTCTFIIYVATSHWITLVISRHGDKYIAYYADSLLTNYIPTDITNLLMQHQIHKCFSVCLTAQHYNFNDSGLWAIQNAFNINIIINQIPALIPELISNGLTSNTLINRHLLNFEGVNMREEYKEILTMEAEEENQLHLDQSVPALTYKNIPLSDQNIRDIVSIRYPEIFNVHPLNNNSKHRLVVVSSDNGYEELIQQIHEFLTIPQVVEQSATCTFIINQGQYHWTTLVIALKQHNSAEIYFADSYGTMMPSTIHAILASSFQDGNTQYTQLVTQVQQYNSYDCGLFAIQYAIYINNMLSQSQTVEWCQEQIEANVSHDDQDRIQIREDFRTKIEQDYYKPNDHLALRNAQELKNAETKLGMKPHHSRCISADPTTMIDLDRTKRAVCNTKKTSTMKEDGTITLEIPQYMQIKTQLYFDIAYLAALQYPIKDHDAKIDSTIKYIGNIYDILHEKTDNRSPDEQEVIKQHYKDVNKFILPGVKHHLFAQEQYTGILDYPIIFRNKYCSLIVYYNDDHYLLYSQNYNYNSIYYTKNSVSFTDIRYFAELLFAVYSSHNPSYDILSLSTNQYRDNALKQLENEKIWKLGDKIKSDLPLLLESEDHKIEDVPNSIIRTIFFVNNQVPDFRLLHDDFFSTHLKSISLRIDQIHKAFLSLDIEQLKSLKRLIKKYDFPFDATYLDKINPTTHPHTKVLISLYHLRMKQKLKHIDELTLGGIEELTQTIFANFMKTLGISSELSASALQNMRTIYSAFAHYTHVHEHKITQASFFIPDLIKTFNYNQYIPLLQSSVVLMADMQASKYMVKLYRRVIDKMKPHLDPNILKTINSIPGLENSLHEGLENAVQNPIFKIMTLYALKQLLQKLDTIDPRSTEYEIIHHKLNEEYATIGFMSLELCNIEMTPEWFLLMIERLRYDGHQIALSHNLDIPAWQETLIGLGFYQENVDYMIEESDLIKYNLALVDAATKHFVHHQNHTSDGLYLIKIPHFLKEKSRYPINAEQVPKNIQTTLINKAYNEFGMMFGVPYAVSENKRATEHNYHIIYYNDRNYTYYIDKYNASGSNTTIIFREYTDQEYEKSGTKDDVFTDVIRVYNSTWLRLPQKVECLIYSLNLECEKPQQSFVTRDTGDAALYYSNKNIDQTLFHKNISYVFDPREGNMSITVTQDVMKKLNQNPKKWYCNIFVEHKDYPAILSFQGEYSQASCTLDDPTNLIIPRYFILNNHSPFMLDDNAKVREITAATVQTPYSNTTYHTIISGTSKNITLDSTDGIKSHRSTIMSTKYKAKLYISLDYSAYLIGDTLSLSDKDIYIDNIRGQSNQSTIVFTGQNDQKFRLTLLGDIVVHDMSHSRLCILGHYQFKGSVYSKWHNYINSYTEYKLDVQDFSSVFNTVRQLLQDNGTQYIEFTDINNVQYKWYRHKSSGHLVITSSNVPGVVLQISSEFNVLELFHQFTLSYSFATVHYNEMMQYNGDCVIKKIFINSNKSFEPTNIIQNMKNASNFNDYSFLSSMNGSMIILFSHGHEWYNIWPFRREITMNNINYKITEDGICHMPSDHTNDNGHNHVLEYVDSNSYYSKNSRVPSCNHEPSRVKARAERSISNADDAVYHPAGISDAYGQDVNNNGTVILDNNSDQIQPITSGGSSLSSFAHTILKSMSAPLSWLITRIKHDYTPLPKQISRQISSVEEDIKIDHELSYTEELNNSITQQAVVEAISSDANSNGTAKMLNHYTNFGINKNNGNSNIINNLKLGDSSHNGSAQVINTFNINGNLMLGQILAYKFCGKNQLFKNTCYLSPTQERNILLEQLSSEVLSRCNDFINDTNTFNYNNAPLWYQDLWQDNFYN